MESGRKKPRFGYRRLHVLRVGGGERVNHKLVLSGVAGGRTDGAAQNAQEVGTRGFAANGADGGEPGMGTMPSPANVKHSRVHSSTTHSTRIVRWKWTPALRVRE